MIVGLQVSDYSQLSNYTVRLQLCRLIRAKYSSLCTNHIFVIVMINFIITCRAKLLNADWLRQRAFFLNQEGMIT